MSRHCLYCAKELPKNATNNFCSKNCWTEYKKLKAMDVGTDKQATILLKRSELRDVQSAASDMASDHFDSGISQHRPSHDNPVTDSDIFVDAIENSQSSGQPYASNHASHTETSTISDRLNHLENLVGTKLQESSVGGKTRLDEISRLIDDMALRLNKLEIDMEKVDVFLRSVDKFEDRLRRIERQIQSADISGKAANKGFFARLFS